MKGFTLVEMLVALAALAVLAAGGFMIVGVSTTSQEALAAKQADTQGLLRLRGALRSDITQASGRRARDMVGAKAQAALDGDQQSGGLILALVRRGWDNPLQQGRASLQYVEYRLRAGQIERYWRQHVDGSPVQDPQVLLAGVERVSVEYFDRDQWMEGWAGAPNRPLPRAIRLTLALTGRGDLVQVFLLPEEAR